MSFSSFKNEKSYGDRVRSTDSVVEAGGSTTYTCDRTVCSECVKKGFAAKEKSRFHHNDPHWKTSLLGCLGSPRLCLHGSLCYYCCEHRSSVCEGSLDVFDGNRMREYVHNNPFGNCGACFPIVCLLFPLITVPIDGVCCCSISHLRRHERELGARFGVSSHSCSEAVCCRHCLYIQLLREAEARGYPQPTCCSSTEDAAKMIAKYPAHPSIVTGLNGAHLTHSGPAAAGMY
mgnify:CR=1 FL=1